ncbi:MAG: DNA-3-methyladenine glycosylase I [Oscillospiraceae bacterium]|nr:DNA-3-methyladenine glycosylase I [Oscillospiraceae bacterium]
MSKSEADCIRAVQDGRPRCRWANPRNPLYITYHDSEWGVPCHDEHDLYELFILESFQAGLSWETILNKRDNFRAAYDNFDIDTVCAYGEEKLTALMSDGGIVRNRRKIEASVRNSRIFKAVQTEYGSWDNYLRSFTGGKIVYEKDSTVTASPLSDRISGDLKKRGMSFVGSTIIYAYLQAIGVINAHEPGCWKCDERR